MSGIGDLASSLVSFQLVALRHKALVAAMRATEDPNATRILGAALVEAGDEAAAAARRVVVAGLDNGVGANLDVTV